MCKCVYTEHKRCRRACVSLCLSWHFAVPGAHADSARTLLQPGNAEGTAGLCRRQRAAPPRHSCLLNPPKPTLIKHWYLAFKKCRSVYLMQEYHPRRRKSTLGSFHESLGFVSVQNTDVLSDGNEKLLQQNERYIVQGFILTWGMQYDIREFTAKTGKEKWNLRIVNGLLHTLQTKTQFWHARLHCFPYEPTVFILTEITVT